MKMDGVTSLDKRWVAKRRRILTLACSASVVSWGFAVLLMNEGWGRVPGICAGLAVIVALFRSVGGGPFASSRSVPLILFMVAMPVLSGLYLTGICGAYFSSAVVLGLSMLWLGGKRFQRGVGLAAFIITICGLVMIPTDVVLRRGAANIQIEPNPVCPLVRRMPRLKCWENEAPGELTAILGRDTFAEVVPNRLRTDGKGFSVVRGSTASRPYDVVLLGDSYTANSAVESWPELLCRDTGLNIRNLGIPATGPWDEYMNFRLEYPGMRLSPQAKILWCLFSGNDLYDFYGPLPYEIVPKANLFTRLRISNNNFRRNAWLPFALKDSGIQRKIEALFAARSVEVQPHVHPEKVVPIDRSDGLRTLFLAHYIDQARKTRQEIEATPTFPALNATIQSMAGFVHLKFLNLTVLVFPSKEEVYGWLAETGEAGKPWSTPAAPTGFGLAVRGLCEKYGLPCHDLTAAFVTNSKAVFLAHGESLWQRDDTHWNEKGHQLTAQMVADIVGSRGKLPDSGPDARRDFR